MGEFAQRQRANPSSATSARALQPRTAAGPGGQPEFQPQPEESVTGAPPGHSFADIAIYPGSIAPLPAITSIGGPLLQRQPAATANSKPPTVADNIGEAIKLLYPVQPAIIFQALSAVTVGGGSTLVRAVPHEEAGKEITSLFMLELKVAPLTGHTKALFQGPAKPAQTDPATRTYAMTITVSPTVAQTAASALARDLFHEGMHMQLFMDRALPSSRSSANLTRMTEYLTVARANSDHAAILADLAKYIRANPKDKQNPVRGAAGVAKEIVEHMIEEKFVVDETNRSSLSPKLSEKPTATELSKSYLTMTTRWLVTYLDQFGVSTADDSAMSSLAARLKSLWLDIDANVSKPPPYPVPIGMYAEPDLAPLSPDL